MSDELDPGLRRLFAATAENPADEAFVAAVAAKTAYERRLILAGQALGGLLLAAVVLAAAATGLPQALNKGLGVIASLVTTPPLGWAAGLALAVALLVAVRTLTPLVRLGRRSPSPD